MKRKIDAMHDAYGYGNGVCRECCNFARGRVHDRHLCKCAAYGMTHSEASDWAGKHAACGLFNKPFEDMNLRPLIETLKRGPRQDTERPLEGQVSLL